MLGSDPSTIQAHSKQIGCLADIGRFAGRVRMSLHMKSRITQPPVTETPVYCWRKDIALEHLRLERAAAEDRRTETVARLAIDLARAKCGRPRKDGANIVPDVEEAVRLLAESEAARRTPRSVKQSEDLLAPHVESLSPTLRWHIAKRGEEPGSGGVVCPRVLCDESCPPDFKIHVGVFHGANWQEVAKWEVLRNEGVFRKFIEAALTSLLAKSKPSQAERSPWGDLVPLKKKPAPREKTPTASVKDIEDVLQMGELNVEFFKELVKARKSLGKTIRKGSADGEARPPRGKRKPSSA